MTDKTSLNILAKFQTLSAFITELADEGNETASVLLNEFNSCGQSLVDYVLACSSEINRLKTKKEETEEEMQKLNAKVEALEKSVPKRDFENCLKLAEKKYSKYWAIMEENSKTFIATAFYIFRLMRAHGADFSPVVIEYSKAVEEEMAQKLYYDYIVEWSKKPLLNDGSKIQQSVEKYRDEQAFFVPFKIMFTSLVKPKYYNSSNYYGLLHLTMMRDKWDMEKLTDDTFCKEGRDFAENVRNLAAHRNSMTEQDAVDTEVTTKKLIYTFLSACPSKK